MPEREDLVEEEDILCLGKMLEREDLEDQEETR